MFKKFVRTVLGVAVLYIIIACSSSTRITGVWRNNSTSKEINYKSYAILVLTENVVTRSVVEKHMAEALEKYGKSVMRSVDIIPPSYRDQQLRKEDLMDTLRSKGIEAIVTIAILKEHSETRHRTAEIEYKPMVKFGWYGSFWGYYSHWYPRVFVQDYVIEGNVYYTEINVYDTDSESLIWSAQSETYNYFDLESASEEFSKVVVKEMVKYGILEKTKE
jgi:hypothetical protein